MGSPGSTICSQPQRVWHVHRKSAAPVPVWVWISQISGAVRRRHWCHILRSSTAMFYALFHSNILMPRNRECYRNPVNTELPWAIQIVTTGIIVFGNRSLDTSSLISSNLPTCFGSQWVSCKDTVLSVGTRSRSGNSKGRKKRLVTLNRVRQPASSLSPRGHFWLKCHSPRSGRDTSEYR